MTGDAQLRVDPRKLETELVPASIEFSTSGKAMKFYEVAPFAPDVTPKTIVNTARALSTDKELEAELR
jgi:hypothetical protein